MSALKSAPMTKDETMLLEELVEANKCLTSKATNAASNKMKEDTWQNLSSQFNSSVVSAPRTPAQLRLKWENMKKATRKRYANMRNSCNKTGGGKDYIPPDEVLDKVASMLGATCQGYTVEFGGDAFPGDVMKSIEEPLNLIDFNVEACGVDSVDNDMCQEIEMTPTPAKPKPFFFKNTSGGSVRQKRRIQEEEKKAKICRDNAVAEYYITKKKKLELDIEKERSIMHLHIEEKRKKTELDIEEKK